MATPSHPDPASPAAPGDAPAIPATRIGFDHVGLSVADLAAATDWYCRAFDLRVELRLRVEPIDLDIVMLLNEATGWRVELLHRPGSGGGLRAPDVPTMLLTHGFGHIALDVPDVDATHDRLVALGARTVMGPQPSPEAGVRMAYLADPEGNLVELLDRCTLGTRSGGPRARDLSTEASS